LLLLGSANLSDTYFTNRQDRYVVFRDSPELCNFYSDFLTTMSSEPSLSGQPLPTDPSLFIDPSKWSTVAGQPNEVQRVRQRLAPFIPTLNSSGSATATNQSAENNSNNDSDTWVYPTFQMAYGNCVAFSLKLICTWFACLLDCFDC